MDSSESGSMESCNGEDEHEEELCKVVHMAKSSQPLKVNQLHLSSSSTSSSRSLDPLSCYMFSSSSSGPICQNTTTSVLSETIWSKRQRSDPSFNDLGAATVGDLQHFISPNLTQLSSSSTSALRHSLQVPLPDSSSNGRSSSLGGAKNPKKRTRASRRAPTTVLTTDTNNFRAMVQEYTGIPVPPFASSSIYGTSSSSRTPMEGSPLLAANCLPPYLLKAFSHKIQQPPSIFSQLGHISPSLGASTSQVDATTITTRLSPAIPSSSFDLLAKLNLQRNAFLHSLSNPSLISPSSSTLKMDGLGEFGSPHAHVSSSFMQLQSSLLASSSQETMGTGTSNLHIQPDDQFMRSVSGNVTSSQSASNFSGNNLSGFGFHGNRSPPGHDGLHS